MSAVSRRLEEFGDATVTVVFFDVGPGLDAYRSHVVVDDRIRFVVDADRTAYRALDLGRGRATKVWGPKTFLAYGRLLLQGRSLRRHTADALQLGGDVVIGADGRLVIAFRPPAPDERPSIDQLIEAVEAGRLA